MSEVLRYPDKVKKVEEHFTSGHVSGAGTEAKFKVVSAGWFITLESGAIFPCGKGRPEFNDGDPVRLTIENLASRQPSMAELLARAKRLWESMTPDEKDAMLKRQAEGWARSEIQWAKDFAEGKCARD